jgi:hypothetical protein
MATPREQHHARPGARVVGSGHLDGREPAAELRAAAVRRAHEADDAPAAESREDPGITPDSAIAERNERYAG